MSQSSPSRTCLLDLPNELLLIISEDLDDDSLLHLAATCERINLLLLPGIFTRFGCDLSPFSGVLTSFTITGETLKLLSAIGIASFIKSINVLDCVFTARSRTRKVWLTFPNILLAASSLNSLAIRLSHLGHLRFNPYALLHSSHELAGWLHSLAAFLNSAARRGECTITVYCVPEAGYGADPRPFLYFIPEIPRRLAAPLPSQTAPPFSMMGVLQKLVSFFRPSRTLDSHTTLTPKSVELSATPQLVERSAAPGSHMERKGVTTVPFVSHPALETLNIHAPLLFHATFYRWTLHTLNTAPITTLSLDLIDLSHYDWALTLPLLTLPALTSLRIGQCAVPVPDLTLFLARHPIIHTLDLSFHIAIGALSPPVEERILPRLASLRGTPDYLLYFLAEKDGEMEYPDLRRVGVSSNDDSAYEQAQFAQLIACVEARRVVPAVELAGKLANHCQVPAHLQ